MKSAKPYVVQVQVNRAFRLARLNLRKTKVVRWVDRWILVVRRGLEK